MRIPKSDLFLTLLAGSRDDFRVISLTTTIIKILKILKIFKIDKYFNSFTVLYKVFKRNKELLLMSFMVAFMYVFLLLAFWLTTKILDICFDFVVYC
jgi:hypothetical protein